MKQIMVAVNIFVYPSEDTDSVNVNMVLQKTLMVKHAHLVSTTKHALIVCRQQKCMKAWFCHI